MFAMQAVGYVKSDRTVVADDGWDAVRSRIELTDEVPAEALDGIEAFSHAEVVYVFDRVKPESVVTSARHPRNNPAWPRVGIFAQRGKARPNRIGTTIVRVLRREGRVLHVERLDAIDGTPVLDIKPVFREFLPAGDVVQPSWVSELMTDYWMKR
jgi:tRNA-Thr(GGU) m(6)t(6)A37 methyltransferase TsaA